MPQVVEVELDWQAWDEAAGAPLVVAGRERVDGALDFAQLLPVEVMGHLFGVPTELGPQFREWVDGMLKEGQIDLDIARIPLDP